MNEQAQQEQEPIKIAEQEPYEEQRQHMEQAFENAVALAVENVDDAERDEIKKQIYQEKNHLIDLALEERGAEFLNRRVEWLSALTSRLFANRSMWPNAPEGLEPELKRYLDGYESKLRLEAAERARKNETPITEALGETLDEIFSQIKKTARELEQEARVHPLTARERTNLFDILSERQALLRDMRGQTQGRSAGMSDVISAAYDDAVRIEKKLHPELPQNLIEIALIDRATFDPETRENATLFPYLAEKKRQENAAHHAQLVEARTAALAHTPEAQQRQEPASTSPIERERPTPMPRAWWKVWQRNNPRSSPGVEKDSSQQ